MGMKKIGMIGGGLLLGALLVTPAAFAGRGNWGGRGCDGPGRWGRQDAPSAQDYRGDSRGGRGCRGPADCYGYDDRGRGQRADRGRGWDCPGPRDCDGPQDCPGPRGQAPAPGGPAEE